MLCFSFSCFFADGDAFDFRLLLLLMIYLLMPPLAAFFIDDFLSPDAFAAADACFIDISPPMITLIFFAMIIFASARAMFDAAMVLMRDFACLLCAAHCAIFLRRYFFSPPSPDAFEIFAAADAFLLIFRCRLIAAAWRLLRYFRFSLLLV